MEVQSRTVRLNNFLSLMHGNAQMVNEGLPARNDIRRVKFPARFEFADGGPPKMFRMIARLSADILDAKPIIENERYTALEIALQSLSKRQEQQSRPRVLEAHKSK